jgi:hypothetical protein
MVNRKEVMGEVVHNDGEFAEIQTFGIDGIETGLLLDTIQLFRCDSNGRCNTNGGPRTFQRKLQVGALLDIIVTVEVQSTSRTAQDLEDLCGAAERTQASFATSVPTGSVCLGAARSLRIHLRSSQT